MAVVIHTDATLGEIVDDLTNTIRRLEDLRAKMRALDVSAVPFDGDKGQIIGRTSLQTFVSSGENALRKKEDEIRIAEAEKRGERKAKRSRD